MIPVQKGAKIDIHAMRPGLVPGWLATLAAQGTTFPVVKSVDDVDWLETVKQSYPTVTTIARLHSQWEGCQGVAEDGANLNDMANRIMEVIEAKIALRPSLKQAVDYWEPVNEPDPPDPPGRPAGYAYGKLAELMGLCIAKANAIGIKLAIFSLNAGTPEYPEMEAMVNSEVFAAAKAGGHILALHEGVFGDDPIDVAWPADLPGAPPGLGASIGAGAYCFRYRFLYHLLKQKGQVIPLAITEFYAGGDRTNGQETLNRVKWYDEKAKDDWFHLGLCLFTVSPVGGWGDQNYEASYPELMTYMAQIKDRPNALDQTPPPDPAPGVDYIVVVNLLPPQVTQEEVAYVLAQTYTQRQTICYSADDTARLVAPGKPGSKVKAWSPGRWTDDIEAWLLAKGVPLVETHYLPGDQPPPPGNVTDGYDSPIGTSEERNGSQVWPGHWVDPNPYLNFYTLPNGSQAYHTGSDLNLNVPAWDSDKGAPVYAIANGLVTFAGVLGGSWGNVIVIRHTQPDGRVVHSRYAHLATMLTPANTQVTRGQKIATIGQPAGGGAFHLHFDISTSGILQTQPGDWPGTNKDRVLQNYVNPLDFIRANRPAMPPPAVAADFGIHTSADGGVLQGQEIQEIVTMQPGVIKVLSSVAPESIGALSAALPAAHWIVRAFLDFRTDEGPPRDISPQQFYNDTINDVRRAVQAIGPGREIWIELHNEPNLVQEGMTGAWENGAEFNTWLMPVLSLYKTNLSGVKFLFPGLSPGETIPGVRQDHWTFLQACMPVIGLCDGLATHIYWAPDYPMQTALQVLDGYLSRVPGKPVWITEACNNKCGPTPADKVNQYITFWRESGRKQRVRGVTFFVMSASDPSWGWSATCQTWLGLGMAELAANR